MILVTVPRSAQSDRAASLAAPADSPHHFLQGGGEMGERMRRLDWTSTSLGPPDAWPQSLKTIVRVMLDSRYAMWMLWGQQMTFFCNDAYLPTVGIKRDWVLGARADKVWEEIWTDIGPRIQHVLENGEATWDEALLLFLERSGFSEETYHTFSYSPVYDDDSRIAGMLCVVTEVTERVIGERRLRVLRDLAARAVGVETVEDSCRGACEVLALYPADVPFAALYLADGDQRRVHLVAATKKSVEDVLPHSLSLVDPTPGWPLDELFAGENAHELDLVALGIDVAAPLWSDRVQRGVLVPLKGSGSAPAGFLMAGSSPRRKLDEDYRSFLGLVARQTGSAISEAQASEAERRRAQALTELDRAKTAFFSNVSHEFRTPLTLMLGPLAEAIADEGVPNGVREQLELAERNAMRLQRLVNSLLDFSRIESGRADATYEPTDLAALTRDLASTFRSAMEKAGLAFVVDCVSDDPVYVDREMWEKIVLNLLSNAFKFTLAGSVTARLRLDEGVARFEVIDTGVGVPAVELPRLFERFHRVEATQGRTHEGSGIGLALVQELVKLHGGDIGATGQEGVGTTISVRIPLGSGHLAKERIVAPREQSPHPKYAESYVKEALRWLPATDGRRIAAPDFAASRDQRFAATFGARIVFADDNADMRTYVEQLLSPYYQVEGVADGAQALAAARRSLPDLILSDVMMPNLDGFGLIKAIRSDETLRDVSVVLLSARAGAESRIEGLDSGADDYVIKPFSARELLARVGALLELRHMRKSAEAAFRRRTEQYETLLNRAPLGVYLVDADFRIQDANPTALAAFGDIRDPVGRDFGEVVHRVWPDAYADEIAAQFRRTLDTGVPVFASEQMGKRLDRETIEYYDWQIHRIPLPDGRNGVVCYFRDVSAQVAARTKLEAADRQKDEFLAMLAHELRNPLAPIGNAGEILARIGAGNARVQQAVGIVQRQVANLTRLVDDLLDVSRITQGRIELRRSPVQLADIIAQAAETVAPLVQQRRHELSVTTFRPVHVNGDAARLVQCVTNLLTNAAKYTDPGGKIQVELRSDGGEALLTVADNGVGIPVELQATVFDLFVQGARTLDRAQGGLGIGLSVVKRLVEMHGGSVSVASEGRGRGAKFHVRLPLLEEAASAEVATNPLRLKPLRILVVDDNQDAANSVAMILALDDHEVDCAYSAQDALERVMSRRPDVALLDIGLPGMNGFELAKRIRERPELASVRLVALTGYGQTEDKARAFSAGFDDYLVKPVDVRALQEALARPPPGP
jgi:signal transduction histidine kinase